MIEGVVEARQLAHEVVEPARRGGKLAQRQQRVGRGAGGPQEQREMREIAALAEDADEVVLDGRRSVLKSRRFNRRTRT